MKKIIKREEKPLRLEVLDAAEMAVQARHLAGEHVIASGNSWRVLLKRFRDNEIRLNLVQKRLAGAAAVHGRLSTGSEWLLDNFYVIAGQLRQLTKVCNRELLAGLPQVAGLPQLANAGQGGLPRIYVIATQLIAHSDGQLDASLISVYIMGYQEVVALRQQELRAMPVIVQLALIENLTRIAMAISDDYFHPDTAGDVQAIHDRAADRCSLRNNLSSLRMMGRMDWRDLITGSSVVEMTLSRDPADVYAKMDFHTRQDFCRVIEGMAPPGGMVLSAPGGMVLSAPGGVTELDIACKAVELAAANAATKGAADTASHVGFYLKGAGRSVLERAAGIRTGMAAGIAKVVSRWAPASYPVLIILLTVTVTLVLRVMATDAPVAAWLRVAWVLPLLVAASQVAITLTNAILTYAIRPRLLPRLDFSRGIPADSRTLVAVPCLLIDKDEIHSLAEALEVRFLGNRHEQLYFGLVTDLVDAKERVTGDDDALIAEVSQKIEALNKKYATPGYRPFFLFHRSRRWNAGEECWMGYERKRGKLAQLNALLHEGEEGDFSLILGDRSVLSGVRYVITLDADTQLPRDAAWKLVATMAHPLNRAGYDPRKRRVTRGYGILQPRVGLNLTAAERSRYIKMQGSNATIDAYTRATSDVYQDLFGNGSFVGKGIYDVAVFARTLADRFPENRILSHDLLEGCLMRSGLATDVQLLEDHPIGYYADTRRRHRWIRGDWQIASYILPFIPAPDGRSERNPLSALSRWKIFDNLRRSFIPLAYILLLLWGWFLSGNPLFWTGAVILMITFPGWMNFILRILSSPSQLLQRHHWLEALTETAYTLLQSCFSIACLPYEALYTADAVTTTLWRLVVSRKGFLRWHHSRAGSYKKVFTRRTTYLLMWINVALPVIVAAALTVIVPESLKAAWPVLALWIIAPAVAWRISQLPRLSRLSLPDEQRAWLRGLSRKTWAYFEHFIGENDNWLPPDYYQEYPVKRISHKTSPTNMGLSLLASLAARDFGYITNGECIARIERTLEAMNRLERYRGHFYNWYDTSSMTPVKPLYISSVDSGNLASHLMVLQRGLLDMRRMRIAGPELLRGIADTVSVLENEGCRSEPLTEIGALLEQAIAEPPMTLSAYWILVGRLGKATKRFDGVGGGGVGRDGAGRDWVVLLIRQVDLILRELQQLAPWLAALPETARPVDLPFGDVIPMLEELSAAGDGYGSVAAARLARIDSLEAMCGVFADQDLDFLYDRQQQLLSIGFTPEKNQSDCGCYDMLASEARVATLVGIAKAKLPQESWFALGRPLAFSNGEYSLLSWSGSMFEYLMPQLVMPSYEHSLLDIANKAAVKKQIRYAREKGIPWGISECAYHEIDINLCYQYGPSGVPELGLQRSLDRDLVIAPYASMLALMIAPAEACANLRQLSALGLETKFGFYEAIDYTAARLPKGRPNAIVRSQMMHHQAMGFLSLAAYLLDQPMQKRLLADPSFKTVMGLLEEPVSAGSAFTLSSRDTTAGDASPEGSREEVDSEIYWGPLRPSPVPQVQLLSNGRYHVMVTDTGGGYSRWKDLALTRWRDDGAGDNRGMFCYIRDTNENSCWSAGFRPMGDADESCRYSFTGGTAGFCRQNNGVETSMNIVISPEDDVEIRRIRLRNVSLVCKSLEVTSYVEVALAPAVDDASHPALSKIFVETEIDRANNAIFCMRRARLQMQSPSCFHVMQVYGGAAGGAAGAAAVGAAATAGAASASFETDRLGFIGRGHTLGQPQAVSMGGALADRAGSVVDPVMAIRYPVTIGPGEEITIDLLLGVGEDRAACGSLIQKYRDRSQADYVFQLVAEHAQAIRKRLKANEHDIQLFTRLAGFVLFANDQWPADPETKVRNRLGQSSLWSYSLSGDLPIVLLRIESLQQIDVAEQLVQAHAYWQMQGLATDLVIWNENCTGYRKFLQAHLADIAGKSSAEVTGRQGSVLIMTPEELPEDHRILMLSVAQLVIKAGEGTLETQLQQRLGSLDAGDLLHPVRSYIPLPAVALEKPELSHFNGTGGFTVDGREYVIVLPAGKSTPMPWVNVLANPRFGTVVSESGQAYTWCENAHEFRITPWYNDPVCDPSGEAFYLRDEEDGHFWSPCPLPARGSSTYLIRHGFGYSNFSCGEHGIQSDMTVFVDLEESIKYTILKIRNRGDRQRSLTITGYVEWILGDMKERSGKHVVTHFDARSGAIVADNVYNTDFAGRTAFFNSSGENRTYTANRQGFMGRNGSPGNPDALRRSSLPREAGVAAEPCAAIGVALELSPGEETEVIFSLGVVDQAVADISGMRSRCKDAGRVHHALEKVTHYWKNILGKVQIQTPDTSLNILSNGWLLYQTLASRYWAKSGYYQSGGAFGFRDQLQDVLALLHVRPEFAREHLLRCASRQFRDGDVLHWWHPPTGRGIRSHCSDDHLWLPFAVSSYIQFSGHLDFLDEQAPFLEGGKLSGDDMSFYGRFEASKTTTSIYDHCVKAICHGLNLGEHGLPLIGSGDWNDSMNEVGQKGKGESIWVAFFLYTVLDQFAETAYLYGDPCFEAFCRNKAAHLAASIERHGWDGGWYLRAFFDDGSPLGSSANAECRIDSICQSWSVLSGAGNPRRSRQAMESAFRHLVRKDLSLIRLLDPPFNESDPDPGYIKGYVPGIRENGGQYTHAAIWLIMAFAKLGDRSRVAELLGMINPVHHSGSPEATDRYKLEPYVMAGDIYTAPLHAGRGGWSWYTGSAGCMYRLTLEYVLGLKVEGHQLTIKPCLPPDWDSFSVRYTYKQTHYHIEVLSAGGIEEGVVIPLINDGREHRIKIDGMSMQEGYEGQINYSMIT